VLTPAQRDTPPALSLRAYGRSRRERGLNGGSVEAVRRAIRNGRLSRSVVVDSKGKPQIADPVLADAEWIRNTSYERAGAEIHERAERAAAVTPLCVTPVTPPAGVTLVPIEHLSVTEISGGLALAQYAGEDEGDDVPPLAIIGPLSNDTAAALADWLRGAAAARSRGED
jgi:hypothetical protein